MSLAEASFQIFKKRGINKANHYATTLVNEACSSSFVCLFVHFSFQLEIHFQFRLVFQIDDTNETHYFDVVLLETTATIIICLVAPKSKFQNNNSNAKTHLLA